MLIHLKWRMNVTKTSVTVIIKHKKLSNVYFDLCHVFWMTKLGYSLRGWPKQKLA